jgi:TPR repeat protein
MKKTFKYLLIASLLVLAVFIALVIYGNQLIKSDDYSECENSNFLSSAIKGDASSQFMMGMCWNIKKRGKAAIMWYEKAAEQGHGGAQFRLGNYYYDYSGGILKDSEKSFKWYEAASHNGFVKAQSQLALMYYKGEGVKQDFKKCYFWALLSSLDDAGQVKNATATSCKDELSMEAIETIESEILKF